MDENLESKVSFVPPETLQNYIQTQALKEEKFVLVLLETNPKKKHLAFRSLALDSNFQNYFSFVKSLGDVEPILKGLKVEKIPAIVCFYSAENDSEPGQPRIKGIGYPGSLSFQKIRILSNMNHRHKSSYAHRSNYVQRSH